MDDNIIWENTYKGRRLIVKQMSAHFMDWYCGYIEVDKKELLKLGNPITPDDLSLNPVFSDFFGEVTFYGTFRDDSSTIYVGFDTAHFGMEDITLDDCIEALKKTVDRLEN